MKLGVFLAGFLENKNADSKHVGFTFVLNEKVVNHVSVGCTPGFMVTLFYKNADRPVLLKFNPYKNQSEVGRFSSLVQSLPNDCVVAICVSDTIATKGRPLPPLFFDTLLLLGSEPGFKFIGYRQPFSFIGMKNCLQGGAVYSTGSVNTVVRAFVEVEEGYFVQSCLRKVSRREKLGVQIGTINKVYYVSGLKEVVAFNKGFLLCRQGGTCLPAQPANQERSSTPSVVPNNLYHPGSNGNLPLYIVSMLPRPAKRPYRPLLHSGIPSLKNEELPRSACDVLRQTYLFSSVPKTIQIRGILQRPKTADSHASRQERPAPKQVKKVTFEVNKNVLQVSRPAVPFPPKNLKRKSHDVLNIVASKNSLFKRMKYHREKLQI